MIKSTMVMKMIQKVINNSENNILKFIINLLKESNKTKYIVFSQIDDQTLEHIDDSLEQKVDGIYLCVDRYLTTKNLFKTILKSEKYIKKNVFCNGQAESNKLNNLIMLQSGTYLEILIIPFCITYFNVTASDSFAIYLSGNINDEPILKELFNLYINKNGYRELTEEYIKECEAKKLFRNHKANTLYKDVNTDEIIQSFRTITDSDDVSETLRVIQSQSSVKKFSLDKSEVVFNLNDIESEIRRPE